MKIVSALLESRPNLAQRSLGASVLCVAISASMVRAQPTTAIAPTQGGIPTAPVTKPQVAPDALTEAAPPTVQEVDEAIRIASYEELLATPVALKVNDADLKKVESELRRVVPNLPPLEIRGALPAKFSFDLPAAPVGNILQAAASLAGCKFFLVGERLLIAPVSEQSESERKQGLDWIKSVAVGGSGWSRQGEAKRLAIAFVVDELDQRIAANRQNNPLANGADANKLALRVGQLSPDTQKILKQMVEWGNTERRIALAETPIPFLPAKLTSDVRVLFSSGPGNYNVNLEFDSSGHKSGWAGTRRPVLLESGGVNASQTIEVK